MDFRLRINEFLRQYQTTGWLIALMIGGLLLQGILFLVFSLMGQETLYDQVIEALVIPASFSDFIWHPWSLLTYPFFSVEFSLFQILFNGLILWTFGRIHQQLLGEQRTQRLVILGVPLIGLITLIITSLAGYHYQPTSSPFPPRTATELQESQPEVDPENISLPDDSVEQADERTGIPIGRKDLAYLSGLTAIIMILVISSITLVPDYPVPLFLFGQVKIVWVGIVIFLLSWGLWASFFTPMGIAIFLGGLLGFAHVYLLRNGTDLTESIWNFYSDSSNKPRMKVKYGSKSGKPDGVKTGRRKGGDTKGKDIPQEVIDGILDKISDQGYDSLSREEKELLFKASTQKGDEQNQ